MNLNQTLTLKNNCILGYAEAGDPKGKVLILCHGLHSSRLEVKMFHEEMKNIHFWHGELDGAVPVSMAKALSQKIKGSAFRSFEDEGHLLIFLNRVEEILEGLRNY